MILNLSIDPELVAKQLFRPLAMQIIHLFAKDISNDSSEAMLVLNCCFESVCSLDNPALSEFSAECVQEFLKYAIKQTSKLSIDYFWKRVSFMMVSGT